MSSSASADNQDLQTYLDSFNKDIDDGSDTLVTLNGNAMQVLSRSEKVAQKILSSRDDEVVIEDDDDDGTYFVVQSGNCYYQVSGEQALTNVANEPSATTSSHKKIIKSEILQKIKREDCKDGTDEDMEYVLIVENSATKDMEDTNDADPDDPGVAHKEIYEFDENEELEAETTAPQEKELLVTKNVVRLKSVNASSSEADGSATHHCTHCDYKTTKKFLLSRHLKAHSDERPFICSVCERGFKTNNSLMNHVNTHLGNKPHGCKFCEMAFTTSGELVRHVRYRHTGEKPHKCSECDYSSVELSKLRRHMRCHTGERPYQCPHCTYASQDTFKLKRHLRTHTGEKPYQCDICLSRFTQSNSLKTHRLIHSVGDKPVFKCHLCSTTCGRKTDLRIHIKKLHHSDTPLVCKRCGKELPDRYTYKVHSKTHEGEKCYRCKICPYASISMRQLDNHMLIHTGEKPFVCEHCKMTFRQQQLLKRHINLYHTAEYVPPQPREKNHSCPNCKRMFTHKGNLMRHMEIHDPRSNVVQENLKLKQGRKTRLIPLDGMPNVSIPNEAEGEYSSDMKYEIIEANDNDNDDEELVLSNEVTDDISTDYMPISIKNEPKQLISVEVGDEQYMLVEVVQSDDERDDVDQNDEDDDDDNNDVDEVNCITVQNSDETLIQIPLESQHKDGIGNYFGFKEDVGTGYVDSDAKETIQLLQIIDDV